MLDRLSSAAPLQASETFPALRQGGRIVFAATGIVRSTGGIQSANRNVLHALGVLAGEAGAELTALVMHEDAGRGWRTEADTRFSEATFAGQRVPMAAAIARALISARLVVFDHVDLARPLALIGRLPAGLRARTAILAHGSESAKRIKPVSKTAYRAADRVLTTRCGARRPPTPA